MELKEMFNQTLDEKKGPVIDKSAVMSYQRKNRGTSWDDAVAALYPPLKKERKKREPKPKKAKLKLTMAKFRKMAKGAGEDFMADTASDLVHSEGMSKAEAKSAARDQLDQVAWDLAGSLMYDRDVDAFVRAQIAEWQRIDPSKVRSVDIQEWIADYI